jgi:hypothetical protein
MGRTCWIVLSAVAIGLAAGCDRSDSSSKPNAGGTGSSKSPTTLPASTQPATQPVAESHLTIDGRQFTFPPAKLRVSKTGDKITARLYTIDPKAALADDYTGNGYDLLMIVDDIVEPTEVYNAFWQYKSKSQEFSESPHGIFLEGSKYQLQPSDVTARFLGDMLVVRVQLKGQFLQFDQSDVKAAPRAVLVEGYVLAPVEYKD